MTTFVDLLEKRIGLTITAIFLFAFAIRAALWFHSGQQIVFNHVEVVQTAMCFARSGFLGNPYILPTGPTAHVTPAFPFLIGLMYKIAPSLRAGETLKNLLTIGISSLQFALLPLLGRAARLGAKAGIVAGVIGAGFPLLYLECSGDFEAPLVSLTLVVIATALLSMEDWPEQRRNLALLLTGLLCGLCALVSVQLVFCGVAYVVLREFRSRAQWLTFARTGALFAAGLIAGVLPWTLRNWVELGAPVISRDNAGIELYVSNNNETAISFEDNMKHGIFVRIHPHGSLREARMVQALGEVRYNALRESEATRWIRTHPAWFADLTIHRFVAFWLGAGIRSVAGLYMLMLFVLGLIGLWLARTQPGSKLLFFVVVLCVYPLPHYIVQSSPRYRYPIDPVLLVLTGVTVVYAMTRVFGRSRQN